MALEVEKEDTSLEEDDLEDMITSESRAARFLRLKWPNFTKKKANRVNKIKKRLGPLGYIPPPSRPPPIVHKKKPSKTAATKSFGGHHHSALLKKSPVNNNNKRSFTSYYQKSPAIITKNSKSYQPLQSAKIASKQQQKYYRNIKKRLHLKQSKKSAASKIKKNPFNKSLQQIPKRLTPSRPNNNKPVEPSLYAEPFRRLPVSSSSRPSKVKKSLPVISNIQHAPQSTPVYGKKPVPQVQQKAKRQPAITPAKIRPTTAIIPAKRPALALQQQAITSAKIRPTNSAITTPKRIGHIAEDRFFFGRPRRRPQNNYKAPPKQKKRPPKRPAKRPSKYKKRPKKPKKAKGGYKKPAPKPPKKEPASTYKPTTTKEPPKSTYASPPAPSPSYSPPSYEVEVTSYKPPAAVYEPSTDVDNFPKFPNPDFPDFMASFMPDFNFDFDKINCKFLKLTYIYIYIYKFIN